MTRGSGAGVGLLLLKLATLCTSAASPKRVLILDAFGHEVAPFNVSLSAFHATLARELGAPLEFYEISLDRARFQEPEGQDPFVEFLESRITNRPMDLVATFGGPGMDFVVRHHERFFPNTPIVFMAGPPEVSRTGSLRGKAAQVTHTLNFAGMVEDILQLQPQTTNIVVVFGASPLETVTANNCRREFQPFTNRVAFTWLNDLPLEQVLERCATLPPRSFILHVLFLVDVAGNPFDQNEPLRRLHAVANAPIFGYAASELGLGPIGGRLYQDSEVGAQAARNAIRILRGESPGSIPLLELKATTPVYDWRELQRWGISEARLPAGSVVRFRQPTFWELYAWPIAGAGLFCFAQATLITGLLVNRARRRQAEAEAILIADISSRFVKVPAGEVDREIMDAQRRICEMLDLDLLILWQLSGEAPGCYSATHFYSAQQGLQPSEQLHEEDYPWFKQELLAGRTVGFSSLEELPAEAARDRESFRQLGTKSNLSLPLAVGGGPMIGAFCLNATRAERNWPDALVKRVQLMAQIFASALARKRDEQAMRLVSHAIEQSPVLVVITDTLGKITYVNRKFTEVTGYSFAESIGQNPRFLKSGESSPAVYRELWACITSGRMWRGEFHNRKKNGELYWEGAVISPLLDATGRVTYFVGIKEDITERKRIGETLRTSEARLEAGADLAGLGCYEIDYAESSSFVDDRFGEICGIPAGHQQGLQRLEFWIEQIGRAHV